jgi:hypothetical protein
MLGDIPAQQRSGNLAMTSQRRDHRQVLGLDQRQSTLAAFASVASLRARARQLRSPR